MVNGGENMRVPAFRLNAVVLVGCFLATLTATFQDMIRVSLAGLPHTTLYYFSLLTTVDVSLQVGIERHAVTLTHTKANATDFLEINVKPPSPRCSQNGLYRYYITGPSSMRMSGFLSVASNRSTLVSRSVIQNVGKYHVVVIAESLECLHNSSNDVETAEKHGRIVTQENAVVWVRSVTFASDSSQVSMWSLCKFDYAAGTIDFRTEPMSLPLRPENCKGIPVGNSCLVAERCRLVKPAMSNFNAIQAKAGGVSKLRLLFVGNSRVRWLAQEVDRWLKTYGETKPTLPSKESLSHMKTNVQALDLASSSSSRFGSELKAVGLCSDERQGELVYLSSSLWDGVGALQTAEKNSSLSLFEEVRTSAEKLIVAIAELCPDQRRYRMFWMSNPLGKAKAPPVQNSPKSPLVPGLLWSVVRNLSHIHHNYYLPLGEVSMQRVGLDAEPRTYSMNQAVDTYVGIVLQAALESLFDDPLAQIENLLEDFDAGQIKRAVEVGRDEFRVEFVWTSKGTVDSIRVLLLNPHIECGTGCLYRYYIIGPARFSGYLEPYGHGSPYLVARRRVEETGTYRLVVLLESLGRDKPSPLPLWMSSYTNTSLLNITNGKLRLVGFIVSNPDVTLKIDKLTSPNSTVLKSRPVCSFKPTARRTSFRTVNKSRHACKTNALNMTSHCLVADQCRLNWPGLKAFERRLLGSFAPVQRRARMLFLGTSRVEMLFRGMSQVFARPRYHSSKVWRLRKSNETSIPFLSEIRFIETQPKALRSLQKLLLKHDVCNDPERLELIYFSIGIHETRRRKHDLIYESPIEYAKLLQAKLKGVVEVLTQVCPKREMYRIVWMSQPATHVFIKPRFPRVEDKGDLISDNYYAQLQHGTYFLLETRRIYRQLSVRDNSAYFPWNEMTLSLFDEGPVDHLHYWGMNENSAFAKLLLHATT